MDFYHLTEKVRQYINGSHKHSHWNKDDLKFYYKKDKQGNSHYTVAYIEPHREFKISICNNNIKFKNIQNVPGSVAKGRILGPCIKFARHHLSSKEECEDWKKSNEAQKWADYDIQQFTHHSELKLDPNDIAFLKDKSKHISNVLENSVLKTKPTLDMDRPSILRSIVRNPIKSLGRKLTMDECESAKDFVTLKDMSDKQYHTCAKLVKEYVKCNDNKTKFDFSVNDVRLDVGAYREMRDRPIQALGRKLSLPEADTLFDITTGRTPNKSIIKGLKEDYLNHNGPLDTFVRFKK